MLTDLQRASPEEKKEMRLWRLPSHKQYLIAEVLESNDPQNITEKPDTIRDEIIDKTLGEYTAAMATVKLWKSNYRICTIL